MCHTPAHLLEHNHNTPPRMDGWIFTRANVGTHTRLGPKRGHNVYIRLQPGPNQACQARGP